MKKMGMKVFAFLVAGLIFFSGCSGGAETTETNSDSAAQTQSDNAGEDEGAAEVENESQSSEQSTVETMSVADFDNLLSTLPLTVISTQYVVQDDQYKALYPDMLQAVIQNNTTADIKDAVIAFAAWDSNALPVKIEGQYDISGGSYVKEVNYADINLVGGATFGEDSGYSLNEDNTISTFKAIPVSFTTFEGETWNNPYYDAFLQLYEGQKFSDAMTVEVEIVDSTFTAEQPTETQQSESSAEAAISAAELEANLATQPLAVISTQYVVQDDQYKALYPDMLQAVIQNNSQADIKNAVIAFVAWDSNALPVKIEGQYDISGGSYVKEVNYSDINLIGGATYGENSGYSLNENNTISTFKAIAVSYETFDGETWRNPYYDDFLQLYEGQRLSQ